MADELDITILIATYNRAEYIGETLGHMAAVDLEGIAAEFVVVDNNSKDHTAQVIESFKDKMPLRSLFQSVPGKSHALNMALDQSELGKIVVFADDDIVPQKDWLKQILASTERNPEYSVFGGRSLLVWPAMEIPAWAHWDSMKYVFCPHDYGEEEKPYPFGESPCGQNFWVRRETLEGGRRFHDNLGPRPGKYFVMCDDGYFLLQLEVDGYKPLYVPAAAVGHHVQPYLLNKAEAVQRAYRYGGSWPYLRGLSRFGLLQKHPTLWRVLRLCTIFKDGLRYCFTRIPLPDERRMERQATAFACLANNIESLRGTGFIDQRRTFTGIASSPEEMAAVKKWGTGS